MTSHISTSYNLKTIEIEEEELDVGDWTFQSSINPKNIYTLVKKQPIEYFDDKFRYVVTASKNNKNDQKYAYCVQFNTDSGVFQEDLLADFLYQQGFAKRMHNQFHTFEDICLE